jgi:hypothetical protein
LGKKSVAGEFEADTAGCAGNEDVFVFHKIRRVKAARDARGMPRPSVGAADFDKGRFGVSIQAAQAGRRLGHVKHTHSARNERKSILA